MISLRGRKTNVSLVCFISLDQIPKIKIFQKVASEHPKLIEGRRRSIAADVPDSEEADEDCAIYNYSSALDEEDESGSGEAGVRIGVTQ